MPLSSVSDGQRNVFTVPTENIQLVVEEAGLIDVNLETSSSISRRGYSVRIEEIVRIPATADQPGQLVVRTSEAIPDGDAMVTQMLTSPFHMVRVEKADGEGVLVVD